MLTLDTVSNSMEVMEDMEDMEADLDTESMEVDGENNSPFVKAFRDHLVVHSFYLPDRCRKKNKEIWK